MCIDKEDVICLLAVCEMFDLAEHDCSSVNCYERNHWTMEYEDDTAECTAQHTAVQSAVQSTVRHMRHVHVCTIKLLQPCPCSIANVDIMLTTY